jgi:hypothetical protein
MHQKSKIHRFTGTIRRRRMALVWPLLIRPLVPCQQSAVASRISALPTANSWAQLGRGPADNGRRLLGRFIDVDAAPGCCYERRRDAWGAWPPPLLFCVVESSSGASCGCGLQHPPQSASGWLRPKVVIARTRDVLPWTIWILVSRPWSMRFEARSSSGPPRLRRNSNRSVFCFLMAL